MPIYPGVEEEDEYASTKEKSKEKRITPIDEQLEEISSEDETLESKRQRLQEKREERFEREDERAVDKELKKLEEEERHPYRVKLRNRSKKAGSAVKRQVGNAWRHTERVALDVAKYRKEKPPRVIARPRGMRMAPPPVARSNISRESMTSTTERNFFGPEPGEQPKQEKDFFGPPKLLDLIGNSNQPKKEIDLIGNNKNKKNVRYY